ncbi:MAG: hydroxypyruvate isomerase [Rhodobacteraceae bacterium]|nr:MAG: hydroxypyruvate isomerase [Paracoccaceae bacterium]
MKFLANTGFLFPELSFPDRIRAAAEAGFDGVEFHDEVQRHDSNAIADLLAETGLLVGGLNIRMGTTAGCAAIPGAQNDFIADILASQAAAEAVHSPAIHILAGRGVTDRRIYVDNLRHALDLTDRQILIEPICRAAMSDYHLNTLEDALDVYDLLGSSRVKIMFDWYHIIAENSYDDAMSALERHHEAIGHVQAASFPARNEPDAAMIQQTKTAGFTAIGLEYRPTMREKTALSRLRNPKNISS